MVSGGVASHVGNCACAAGRVCAGVGELMGVDPHKHTVGHLHGHRHWPIGVLFDLYGSTSKLPWNLTVHFQVCMPSLESC